MYTETEARARLEFFTKAVTPVAAYIEIDRVLARLMIDCNVEPKKGVKGTNRRSFGNTVNDYSAVMLKDEWLATNQGIGFDINGKMVDGAHRVKALLRACETNPACTIYALVCGGLSERAKRVVDTGRHRTKAQVLGMEGYPNTHQLYAATRLAYCYDNVPWVIGSGMTDWEMRSPLNAEQVLELLATKYPEMPEMVQWGARLRHWMPQSTASVAYYLGRRDAPDGAMDFFLDRVHDGLGLDSALNPIYRLREFLLANHGSTTAGKAKYNRIHYLAFVLKSFNAFLADKEMNIVVFKNTENFPRIIVPAEYGMDDEVEDTDDARLDATEYLRQSEADARELERSLHRLEKSH